MSDIKSTYYLYIISISKVLCHFVVVDWIVYLCLNGQFGGKIKNISTWVIFFRFVIIWDLDTSNSINENVDFLSFKIYIFITPS